MAVLIALIRGLPDIQYKQSVNAWVDMTRSLLYILIPVVLNSGNSPGEPGRCADFSSSQTAQLVQPVQDASGQTVSQQTIAVGPAASQIAI